MKSCILLFSSLLLLAAGCSSAAKTEAAAPRPELKFVQAEEKTDDLVIEVPARIQPDPLRVVRLFPPVSGRVTSIVPRPGDRVHQGEVVAKVQSPDITNAQADLQRSRAERERAARAEERAKDLLEHQVLSEREYEDAHATAEGARADEARAQSRLRLLTHGERVTGDEIALRSPITGVVTDVQGSAGEFTKSLDNSNPLITVADLAHVLVIGDVLESELTKVHAGMPVKVKLPSLPEANYAAIADSVSQVMDPATHTAKLRVTLRNADGLLRPDMFATIALQAGKQKLVAVPSSAIVRDGTQAFVFVKSASGTEKRAVTVVKESNGRTFVNGGVNAADLVVAEGAALLRGED